MVAMNKLESYLRETKTRDLHFAKRAGLSSSIISRLRRGHVLPSLQTAAKIEDATGGLVPMRSWVQNDAR